MMRELDTASPVVWPAWCYSGRLLFNLANFECESQEIEKKQKKLGMTTVEGGVKSERLSPSSSGGPEGSSSRSGTPSSSCTPPRQGGSPSQPLSRNYSDFMRSLAAKYNNNNSTPNDFLSGRNGFTALKAGTSPPFPGLLPPPATTPTGGRTDEKGETGPALGGFPLVPPVFPPALNLDLNATQALLNMVRTQQQLESYLKGASKRDVGNAPLDLSASATAPPPPKKHKKSLSESIYGPDILPLLRSSKRGASGMLSQARRQATKAACASQCTDKPCTPDSQTVTHWTVEDVAGFVASVEMCSEYAQNFRDQRIDGSALALLTEEHLTSALNMKLGPALKLRSILSTKLGQCNVCRHCIHCHGPPPEK
uniref:SAM domain-containing protein n=1 Tax=Lygus hesperus TaxID=30085 RepID=A0A0K8T449_LYGHE